MAPALLTIVIVCIIGVPVVGVPVVKVSVIHVFTVTTRPPSCATGSILAREWVPAA